MNTTTSHPPWRAVLREAASIVEAGWCQEVLHRNENGEECDLSGAIESCAEGAISRAGGHLYEELGVDVQYFALMGLRRYLGKRSIAGWNDHP